MSEAESLTKHEQAEKTLTYHGRWAAGVGVTPMAVKDQVATQARDLAEDFRATRSGTPQTDTAPGRRL